MSMAGLDDTERDDLEIHTGEHVAELGDRLVKAGKLTPRQIAKVTEWQRRHGLTFSEAAIAKGLVRQEDLLVALSRQYSYPIIDRDPHNERFSRELVVGHEPFGPVAEAIRSIRSALVASTRSTHNQSFVVAGARKGVGTTFIAANLALSFAQMSLPTLLVETDLRSPRLGQMFGLDRNGIGLSELLRHKHLSRVPTSMDVIPGLSILTAGSVSPNPQELLCSGAFFDLIEEFQSQFGAVVYDTAPALEFADASVVSARIGNAILVARQHKSTFNDMAELSRKLKTVQCNVLGTIMNSF
ncbi:CpsD/CapB family tyrosine-protein kinase [Lichenifustis flavocetrariae]|uniref:Polysaccharide biosynthesis tyrosine autokinase n=1 Tax=Lichenifustis flavocetrariae TaxID=2949735 RepID=A0AA41YXH6_9HYPH|nr:polysaccharide biosynthesis tyrosine autokinase [Lichenifustis flavocetrariae]MCW6509056.1 polysaccharide biosynthesis tyrosine autokinase [Lichenifustis flavocetrariae]